MSRAVPGEPRDPPPAGDIDPVTRPTPHRRRLAEWPLGLVLLAGAVSLVVVAAGHFRRGTVLLSLSVCLAALLRALVPARSAGLLAVRSRVLDVAMLTLLGIGMLVLALVVPPLVKTP